MNGDLETVFCKLGKDKSIVVYSDDYSWSSASVKERNSSFRGDAASSKRLKLGMT